MDNDHEGSPAKGILTALLLSLVFWALLAWIFLGAPNKAHAMTRLDRANYVVISADMRVLDAFSML